MKRTAFGFLFSIHSKICIIGGGTGGINLSTHLMRANIPGSDIRIIEPAEYHYYQPGWTMLGADLCSPELTRRKMRDIIPWNVKWTKEKVINIDAEKNTIHTDEGKKLTYDNLIVSSGLELNYEKVKGMKEALDDPTAQVGTIYDIRYAEKLSKMGKKFKGGKALFAEPPPPIKCGGSPQKILYLWTDRWTKNGFPV
jgi:NADPH-dependent 2,4-dienoyl-CoA reductase/sulfur reductase-like enzyme